MSLAQDSAHPSDAVSRALLRALARGDGLIAQLPVGVYSCDVNGVLVQYNDRAAALWGRTPTVNDPTIRYCGAYATLTASGAPLAAEDSPMAQVLLTGQPLRDVELIIMQPTGERLFILANVEPLFDDDGLLVGGVNCFQDITARKTMERNARRGARAFRELIDALPAAIYTTNADGVITFYNRSAIELWGREPELNVDKWCGSYRILTADGAPMPHDECPMAVALKTGEAIRNVEAMLERPDGSRVPFMPFPTPFHDASGVLLGAINMMVDITERKKAEAQQKIMVDELNHRVKNTLATVQAMAAQTFRAADAPREDVKIFMSRLLALSATHDHLTRDDWASADLSALLRDVLKPMSDRIGNQISIDGAPVRVIPRAALTLSLAFNELATNAVKYGALSTPEGTLGITWRVAEGELWVSWRESGGPPVEAAPKRGFGTRMIERGVASELDGHAEMRFAPAGFECDLRLPRSALA